MVQVEGSDLFEYTESQKAEIIGSVQRLPKYDSNTDFIADLTLRVLNHGIEDQKFIHEVAAKHAKLNREIMMAIGALANALDAEVQAFAEDFEAASLVAEVAGSAQAPLETIYEAAQVQAGQFHRLIGLSVVDRLVTQPLKVGPNAKPFQQRFLVHVAFWWNEFGGRFGREQGGYERYFNAVVKPVLQNRKVSHATGSSWTDSLFKVHVADQMRKHGVAPKRGRKRIPSLKPEKHV